MREAEAACLRGGELLPVERRPVTDAHEADVGALLGQLGGSPQERRVILHRIETADEPDQRLAVADAPLARSWRRVTASGLKRALSMPLLMTTILARGNPLSAACAMPTQELQITRSANRDSMDSTRHRTASVQS